ncbi:MAG: hypothetical protein KME03_06065 [Aphanocapsa lilacina HA4352-LM1]|nr:hypothetical protein [Aphanocapsa lilacina HA4352-LM1]
MDGTAWKPVELEGFDGEATPFEQLNDDGIFRFVTSDNAFLYRFSSYADSYPPVQIWQLNADQFENISFDMRYRPLHSKRLAEMWNTLKTRPFGDSGINGTLAGYVATKAVLGELGSGWELMLKRYDRTSDTGLTECRGEYDDRGRCKGQLKRYTNFPAALRTFLFESGYIKSGN